MADYFHASITIPKKFIDEDEHLQQLIKDENFNDEPDDEEDGLVQYSETMAHNGEFEYLENYLREAHIPFDRNSSAHYEIDGEHVSYRPAAQGFPKVDVILYCLGDGDEAIGLDEIKKMLDESKSDEEIASKLRAIRQEHDPISLKDYMEQYGDKIITVALDDAPVTISGDFSMAIASGN